MKEPSPHIIIVPFARTALARYLRCGFFRRSMAIFGSGAINAEGTWIRLNS